MYKFITFKCTSCGTVIYNLPEVVAKKIKSLTCVCEDCNCHNNFIGFETKKDRVPSSKHTTTTQEQQAS